MGKADEKLQVAQPLFMPHSPLPATQKLPSRQYLVFSTVRSFMILLPNSSLPVWVCLDELILGTRSQERDQQWNLAVNSSWFSVSTQSHHGNSKGPYQFSSSWWDASPSYQDHLPAALTNTFAHHRPVWHLRIKIPWEFAFDESQPRQPNRSSHPP